MRISGDMKKYQTSSEIQHTLSRDDTSSVTITSLVLMINYSIHPFCVFSVEFNVCNFV